ncbi:MAG: dicarboxylate/amino acid:cation symporter [Elusimicrobia bacterium CG1_02_63_36]|nr:MAG: dicarboxylate/amino acid:cation symporter [Elusimicrobia bacterium CG1_02_63_36]PIP82152.1 MAG: dicarboxylate/amino acid:cation symporter [Elusimicrobia bacterium CG22_combo_CG10-13_8_21_14_all_63_91]PJA14048.1 MAG: dicarboxylate/amino acid:cation symporter [Elusimicrobia bacterium CG_4_10_14_0_2_um_filter_63_34]PJB22959.1 MAG: dicarboxylate/amino acid:cation symporter [Elusimicrobia bacterium CG_4_9_14_3_um_filter_62_55]
MTPAEPKRKPLSLTRQILIAMAAGLAIGVLIKLTGPAPLAQRWLIDGIFLVGGKVFLAALKLLVVPLVFVSLVCGTASLDDIAKLGRVGGKTLGLYIATTAVAISLAIAVALLIAPGAGFELSTTASFQVQQAPPLSETFIAIFPTNPFKAMAEGNMLQVIVFSILFGLALCMTGDAGKRIGSAFEDLNTVVMKLVMMIMMTAPYGVFCLIAKVFAEQGLGAILPLVKYFGVVVLCLALHAGLAYPAMLKVLGGLSPLGFLKKARSPLLFAFSTASSNATLPVTLETAKDKMGVHNSIASFTIPLGATINMDGTAIMQGVATVFIAQAYGIDLGVNDYAMVVVTATLASIGTAGVPGVGLIMLAMVLKQVHLPVEGIGLIIGVDRLLDMMRTAVNTAGDLAVTCVVARSERQLDMKIFNADTRHAADVHLRKEFHGAIEASARQRERR